MRALRVITVSLGFIALSACDATSVPAPTTTGQVTLDEATEASRRLRVGKGDNIGSCEDSCGGKSSSGTCWCDDLCAKYGDCCDDLAASCEADEPCFVGGCSNQLCSDEPGAISICDYKPEYACYGQHSACERQPDGGCAWTPSEALTECLAASAGGGDDGCPALSCDLDCPAGLASDDAGCEICECAPAPASASCEDSCGEKSHSGDCYCDELCDQYGDCCADKAAVCDGPALCPPIAQPDPADCPGGQFQPNVHDDGCIYGFKCVQDEAPCFVGGCSGQLCGDVEGIISTCEWKQEYACYKGDLTTCERQADGSCGWTQTNALLECIDAAVNACQTPVCTVACQYGHQLDEHGCELCACNPPPSACEGHCGGKADEGCWCDEFCAEYGDCCPGLADVCQ